MSDAFDQGILGPSAQPRPGPAHLGHPPTTAPNPILYTLDLRPSTPNPALQIRIISTIRRQTLKAKRKKSILTAPGSARSLLQKVKSAAAEDGEEEGAAGSHVGKVAGDGVVTAEALGHHIKAGAAGGGRISMVNHLRFDIQWMMHASLYPPEEVRSSHNAACLQRCPAAFAISRQIDRLQRSTVPSRGCLRRTSVVLSSRPTFDPKFCPPGEAEDP